MPLPTNRWRIVKQEVSWAMVHVVRIRDGSRGWAWVYRLVLHLIGCTVSWRKILTNVLAQMTTVVVPTLLPCQRPRNAAISRPMTAAR